MHVGGGGCKRAATLEKPRCFPKRRQLLASPPLTAPSPHSYPLSQLSPAAADRRRARIPPDSITGERIIAWPVAMAVSTFLFVMHYFLAFDPAVDSIHGGEGNGE